MSTKLTTSPNILGSSGASAQNELPAFSDLLPDRLNLSDMVVFNSGAVGVPVINDVAGYNAVAHNVRLG